MIDSSSKGVDALCRVASRGTAGGTNFDQPLQKACEYAAAADKADVLMLTDGFCGVSKATLEMIQQTRNVQGMRFFSLLVGGGNASSCKEFSDKVWEAADLSVETAGEIFKEV